MLNVPPMKVQHMRTRRIHRDHRIDLVSLRERLAENAFLFEHPDDYAAGVADALDVVREELVDGEDEEGPVLVEG